LVLASPALEIDYVSAVDSLTIINRRPALISLFGLIAGILISNLFGILYLYSFFGAITVLILAVYLYMKGLIKAAGYTILALIFFIGWLRTDISNDTKLPNHISNIAETGGMIEITGRVVFEPDVRDKAVYLVVEPDSVLFARKYIPVFGKIRVKVNYGEGFDYADIIRAKGYLYKPGGPRNPGGFDYGGYLRTKSIFAAMSVAGPGNIIIVKKEKTFLSSVVKPVRNYIISVSEKYLSTDASAILTGFIIGERRNIPVEYQKKFQVPMSEWLSVFSPSRLLY